MRSVTRRDLIKFSLSSVLAMTVSGSLPVIAAVMSDGAYRGARIWPSATYTRITLECTDLVAFKHFILEDPLRLVIDLEGGQEDLASLILQDLPSKVSTDDPYILGIRVAPNRPGVIRVVVELKTPIKPQVFRLKPFGDYGHRVVLDLYPSSPVDDIVQILEREMSAADSTPLVQESTGSIAKSGTGKRPSPKRVRIIALDAGHGGEDPGAVGPGGTYEKNITLAVARRLKREIDAIPGFRAVLIRDGDYFIPLHRRVERARRAKAELFISIHADAFTRPTARGSSVFVLSRKGASSAAARWLADKENSADMVGGLNLGEHESHLAKTLLDLSLTATQNDSMRLAKEVLGQIGRINVLHKDHVEHANFAVLRAPDIPSILVETAFISNPKEEALLRSASYQDSLAKAILGGIVTHFGVA